MNPAGALLWGSPGEVYAEALRLLEIGASGRHILGTGCEVAVNTPAENMDAMIRAARERSR
jgi:uroporphyrinogen decarboxylase